MGGSYACHLQRPLHIGTWGSLEPDAAGLNQGGQDKVFFFVFLWVLDSPVSKPPLCFLHLFFRDFMP